jgi:hypothetical protein
MDMPEVVLTRNIGVGGDLIQSRISITAGAVYQIDESIPGPSTNLQVALVIDVSQLKAIYLHSDKAMTLYFNDTSSGSPSKTLALAANQAFAWDNLSLHANPFGVTDVTTVYVTKSGSGAARLRGYVLTDPTV